MTLWVYRPPPPRSRSEERARRASALFSKGLPGNVDANTTDDATVDETLSTNRARVASTPDQVDVADVFTGAVSLTTGETTDNATADDTVSALAARVGTTNDQADVSDAFSALATRVADTADDVTADDTMSGAQAASAASTEGAASVADVFSAARPTSGLTSDQTDVADAFSAVRAGAFAYALQLDGTDVWLLNDTPEKNTPTIGPEYSVGAMGTTHGGANSNQGRRFLGRFTTIPYSASAADTLVATLTGGVDRTATGYAVGTVALTVYPTAVVRDFGSGGDTVSFELWESA